MSIILLYLEFFKIGLFAIGGGLATLPFLFDLSVQHSDWLTYADISNMIAVSESTPGPLGINMATYVGNNVSGVFGGIAATIGLITPSIIIILIIAKILSVFKENKYVKYAFYGLKAAVIAMIAYAGYQVLSIAVFSSSGIKIIEAVLFSVLLVFMFRFRKIHPVFWIFIAGLAGIILGLPSK